MTLLIPIFHKEREKVSKKKKNEPNNPDKSFSAKPHGKFVSRYMIELFAIIDEHSHYVISILNAF